MRRQTASADATRFDVIEIAGVPVHLPRPDPRPWQMPVSRPELSARIAAAWLAVDGRRPLNPRIYGPPGSGKNMLAMEAAFASGRPVYTLCGNEGMRPEDLTCTPVLTAGDRIVQIGSGLVACAWAGGIAVIDEIAKIPAETLTVLAPALDHRREVPCTAAGFTIKLHPDCRIVCLLNEDEEQAGVLRGYMDRRTRPAVRCGHPPRPALLQILRSEAACADSRFFDAFVAELPPDGDDGLSPALAVTVLTYAWNMAQVSHGGVPDEAATRHLVRTALAEVMAAESALS